MMTEKYITIEQEVYNSFQELELKLHRTKDELKISRDINSARLAKINELEVENIELRRLLKSRECPHTKLVTIEYCGRPVRQCYHCQTLEKDFGRVTATAIEPVKEDPKFTAIACIPCGVHIKFTFPREIKSSVCQLCGEQMELRK